MPESDQRSNDPGHSPEADAAVVLWEQSLRPVVSRPIILATSSQWSKTTMVNGKLPQDPDWGRRTFGSEDEIREAYRNCPGAGVGMALGLGLGGEPGPIDLEVDDRATGEEILATIFGREGPPPTMCWGSTRGEHRVYMIRTTDARRLQEAGVKQGVLAGSSHPCLAGLEVRLGTTDPSSPKSVFSIVPPTRTMDQNGTASPPRRYLDPQSPPAPMPRALIDYLIRHLGKAGRRTTSAFRVPDRKGLFGLTPIERCCAQLEKVSMSPVRSGDGYASRCPAHRGSRQNLSFRETDDGLLLIWCHRGCTFDDIMKSLNLTAWDARYVPSSSHESRGGPQIDLDPRNVSDEQREKFAYILGRSRECRKANPRNLTLLANRLGVSSGSLMKIGVGWREDVEQTGPREWSGTGRWAWIFPERDGHREVVGLLRRYEDETLGKRTMRGGRRGLTIPRGWETGNGPIYLVEGASDVAAALTLGWTAIGRPQANDRRIEQDLVALLAGDDRDIVVVSDRDEAGLAGARRLARALRSSLAKSVTVVLPPGRHKDLRDYLRSLDDTMPRRGR